MVLNLQLWNRDAPVPLAPSTIGPHWGQLTLLSWGIDIFAFHALVAVPRLEPGDCCHRRLPQSDSECHCAGLLPAGAKIARPGAEKAASHGPGRRPGVPTYDPPGPPPLPFPSAIISTICENLILQAHQLALDYPGGL